MMSATQEHKGAAASTAEVQSTTAPMTASASTAWIDPSSTVWGFHIHQEVLEASLDVALAVQARCQAWLRSEGIAWDAEESFSTGGYGPHLQPMWELRIERLPRGAAVLRALGRSIAWMCVNRCGLPAYIHPTMHDESLPPLAQLRMEGETNQCQSVWFGHRVEQKQAFFFEPPLTPNGTGVVDTRTERIMSSESRAEFAARGERRLAAVPVANPSTTIIRGFHVHVDYTPQQEAFALSLFDGLMIYLLTHGYRTSSTRLYEERENGPHVQRGWEVKFEVRDFDLASEALGVAVAWLMCNRGELPMFAHPVTWEEGAHDEELQAHEHFAFFLDHLPQLDLDFFRRRGGHSVASPWKVSAATECQ